MGCQQVFLGNGIQYFCLFGDAVGGGKGGVEVLFQQLDRLFIHDCLSAATWRVLYL